MRLTVTVGQSQDLTIITTLTVCPGVKSSSLKCIVGMGQVPSGAGMQAPPMHCDEAQGHWLSPSGAHACKAVSV